MARNRQLAGVERRRATDEVGTPDEFIEECSCGVMFRRGEEHRCGHVGEWVSWERYQARQDAVAEMGGGR